MKIMTCPLNGPRPVSEFVYWGEVRPMPDPATCQRRRMGRLRLQPQRRTGVKKEWWCHTPSNTWFIAERDTEKDMILRTYLHPGEE
jgi:sarcosine oxidase subunit delta